jgi:PAS domain S-box-containing protein
MGVFDLDMVNDSLWWSPQTYVVFGVSPETFTPTREAVADLVHPDDRQGFVRGRLQAIAEHRPFVHEFRAIRPDGRIAWISHRGQAEYDASGRAVRSFGVSLDVTAHKLAELALQEADRKKDSFIATLAHELRNPLAPIRNAVQLLRKGGHDDPQVVWARDVIDRQVTQMARLLEDLLDVSRLTRGEFALRRERISLAAVVEQAVEIAQPLIDEHGHALSLELPAAPLHVDGDLTRLGQVFSNLLINAAKYTPSGGRLGVRPPRSATRSRCASATTASASRPSSCRACSRCSARATRSPSGPAAAWASACRSPAAWSRCTAERSAR